MEKEKLNIKSIYILSIATLLLSMIAWRLPILSLIITVLAFFFVFYFTSKNIKVGLFLAIAEILLGSFGKLFFITTPLPINISFRLSIFLALIFGSFVYLLKKSEAREYFLKKIFELKSVIILIGVFILVPFIVGLINQSFLSVFQDINAWFFYALIIPGLAVEYHKKDFEVLIKLLVGTSLATITLTIFLYVLYGWSLTALPVFSWLYHWLRQVGWGEVTHVSGNLYRIFSQAHISVLALWAICLTQIVKIDYLFFNKKLNYYLFFLTSLTLIINLSRSMWVAGVFLMLVLFLLNYKNIIKIIVPLSATFLLAVIISGSLIGRLGVLNLSSRASQQPSEPAIASRIAQLKPLLKAIESHWLTGTGFGGKVGYPSEDPRAKQKLDGQGLYWTSAFEWGYLDQLLKFGLVVFVVFFYFLSLLIFKMFKNQNKSAGLILSVLIVVFVTHVFSPYLNHPLGIIWLIISLIFLYNLNNNYEQSKSYN